MSQTGWKHRVLISGMFTAAGLLVLFGVAWHWVKDVSPAVTSLVARVVHSAGLNHLSSPGRSRWRAARQRREINDGHD
jgi:hypothetical protein